MTPLQTINQNILITGGAGFIGAHLATELCGKGYYVTVLDTLSPQVHGDDPQRTSYTFQSLPAEVNFIQGSVTSKKDLIHALQQQHVIVHLAAETGTGQSMYNIHHYTNVNIGGTALLLDILANTKHTVQKIVVASSRAIYGEGKYFSKELGVVYPSTRKSEHLEHGNFEANYPGATTQLQLMPTDEDSKIHPASVYGISKQNQEQMILTVCEALGIAGVALRYQNVYGPGQSLNNPYTGILSIFSTLIRNHRPINIFEDGKESRDFVYISDVVQATVLAIENDKASNNIYNVGYGKPVDVLTVAQNLCSAYNIDVPLNISGNFRVGDIRHNYACIKKIQNELGYIPQFNFEQGIQHFADWVKEQPVAESKYETSILELKERGLYK
ncbi:MAG: NAD-dependent epimerase/dehydratase family protein [Panacibacter sp.]